MRKEHKLHNYVELGGSMYREVLPEDLVKSVPEVIAQFAWEDNEPIFHQVPESCVTRHVCEVTIWRSTENLHSVFETEFNLSVLIGAHSDKHLTKYLIVETYQETPQSNCMQRGMAKVYSRIPKSNAKIIRKWICETVKSQAKRGVALPHLTADVTYYPMEDLLILSIKEGNPHEESET